MSPVASPPAAQNRYVPGVSVRVDGAELDPKFKDRLVEVRVEDNLALPDSFEIRISDPDLSVVDTGTFAVGAKVSISFGGPEANSLKQVLEGEITSVEAEFDQAAVLVVRGYDKSHRLNRARKVRTFQNVSYADVARKVAGEAGLSAGTIESTASVFEFIQQNNQTDWEFLWQLARRIDFEVVVEGEKLHFRKASTAVDGPTLTWGENLRSFRPRLTGVQQVEEVTVRGWDHKAAQAVEGRSSNPNRSVVTKGVEGIKGKLGSAKVLVADAVESSGFAGELAASVMSRLGNAAVEATGVATGDASLRAGTTVTIEGVGSRFSGKYRLSSTTHISRTRTGYETRFTIGGRAPRNLVDLMNRSRSKGFSDSVVVGVVTNTNDPEQIGRVRVKFPGLGDSDESFWARVLVPNAGKERGIYMMPQSGDEVLVAFLHDQPEYPYVLGSVFNGKNTPGPDLVKQDGSFGLRSPKDIVSDAKETVLFTCKDLTIEAQQDITHKSSSGNLTIEVKNANKQKSQVAEIEAQTVKVKGAAVTVEATGSLTLKGAAIDINGSGPVNIKGAIINIG